MKVFLFPLSPQKLVSKLLFSSRRNLFLRYSSFSLSPCKAFTLLEVLIIVAILSLLLALLLPVFNSARERGRTLVCAQNEQQIGTALLAYAQDYNETLPSPWFGTLGGASLSWRYVIRPWLKNPGVFVCPSNPIGAPEFYRYAGPNLDLPYCYAPNRSVMPQADLDGRVGDLNAIKDPSITLLLLENRTRFGELGVWAVLDRGVEIQPPEGFTPTERQGAFQSHLGKINFLFADGHTHLLSLRQTLTPREMWQDNLRDPNTPFTQEWCDQAVKKLPPEYE